MKKTLLLLCLALCCGTATAQIIDSLPPLYFSDPGVRPMQIFTGFGNDEGNRFDANGDDRPDLVLQREDSQGNLQGLLVIDSAFNDTLWRVQDVQGELGITSNMA